MRSEFAPAIDALEKDLLEAERKANEIKSAINTLCIHAGLPARYQVGASGPSRTITEIRSDTFYGKKMSTAIREYMDMRKAADLGPAKPRDVYDALVKGGFQFGSKDENVAMTVLRATMRKNSTTFHRLPDGAYGLLAWYPDAKATKDGAQSKGTSQDDDAEADIDNEEAEEDKGIGADK
jgi:hypothetical protein